MAQTAITGNLVTLTGANVTSKTFVRFTLVNCGGNQPRVQASGVLVPIISDFTPNGSGAISGNLYSNDVDIEVGGVVGQTFYKMEVFRNGISLGFDMGVRALSGGTLNINNITPITTNPVVAAPTGDTVYARLDGGNQPFTGQILARNGSASAPGLAFATSAAAGFFQQASNVIGVAILSALKWLINSAGILFGSAQAIAWSSNSDPSLAAGDSWLTRIGAAILAIGSTNGGTNGELRLSKVNKITITQPANGSTLTLTDGITLTAPVTGTAATGTGTTNKVPKYTTGASAIVGDSSITDNGTSVSSSLPFTLTPNKQIFTSTGSSTFTIPTGVTAVKVTLVGAGGAGGGGTATANTGGPGGGSGAMAVKWLTGLTPGNTISTSVGTGGTGVSGGSGNAGGNTTISSGTQSITTVTAGGGGGGTGGAAGGAFGGGGGSATNGDLNFSGNEGQFMIGNTNTGQNGTASPFAGGAPRGASAGANNGNSGNSVGAGGSGGGGGTGNTTGGAGANGLIVFEWIS